MQGRPGSKNRRTEGPKAKGFLWFFGGSVLRIFRYDRPCVFLWRIGSPENPDLSLDCEVSRETARTGIAPPAEGSSDESPCVRDSDRFARSQHPPAPVEIPGSFWIRRAASHRRSGGRRCCRIVAARLP